MPHQALLSAPRRSGARHRPPAHLDQNRSGPDEADARPFFRPVSADVHARYSGWRRQGSDRAELYRGNGSRRRKGLRGTSDQRRLAPISAAYVSALAKIYKMAWPPAAAPRSFRRTMVRKITYCMRKATTLAPMAPTEINHAQTLNGSVKAMAMFSAPRANMSAAHA